MEPNDDEVTSTAHTLAPRFPALRRTPQEGMTRRGRQPPRPQEVGPGHYEAHLVAWIEGDDPDDEPLRGAVRLARERSGTEPGRTLADMRAEFGGDEGFVKGPERSGRYAVSLAPWRDADPERTRLMPSFKWVSDDPDLFNEE
jgi:hypothetical protein